MSFFIFEKSCCTSKIYFYYFGSSLPRSSSLPRITIHLLTSSNFFPSFSSSSVSCVSPFLLFFYFFFLFFLFFFPLSCTQLFSFIFSRAWHRTASLQRRSPNNTVQSIVPSKNLSLSLSYLNNNE
ncbi:hypothetical protein I3843_03G131900 [Carya illinoinensis]|nr:hypothetical protein I3843_03G131900 [Carya illinoinensis]